MLAATLPPFTGSRMVELRLALSASASRAFSESRLRRLIEIETESFAVLAPGTTGPLGDHVAYVWLDQPSASKGMVEVRVGDGPVDRREIAVRGLAGDVAARLMAVAVSEMVRAGLVPRPAPPPPPPMPHRPTVEALERAARSASAVVFTLEGALAGIPAASGILGGVGLSLGFRSAGATEALFARWMDGAVGSSELRWLELGLAADYRLWLGRAWRLVLGGSAALASLHLADVKGLEQRPGEHDTWSARGGGLLGVEARITPSMWLSFTAEPGVLLRPVRYLGAAGGAFSVEGAWLGAGLALRFERVRWPDLAAPP